MAGAGANADDSVDNSSQSSNWDHSKNWKKMKERQHRIDKGLKEGRSMHSLWTPTSENSAGKGSRARPVTDKERYDLNYDLPFGLISKEEHTQRMNELDGDSMATTDEE